LNSLDISYQHEFLEAAVELIKDHTVLIAVMHDINLAAHYADNLFFFKEGELIEYGKPKDILTENVIEKVFNVKTAVIENPVTGKPLVIYN
jgi:iron complex transport system ATP-binding protein